MTGKLTRVAQTKAQVTDRSWPAWQHWVALSLLLALTILIFNLLALRLSPTSYRVDLGVWQDQATVEQFHQPEQDARGTSYRWTNGSAALRLGSPATAAPARVTLEIGGVPPGLPVPHQLALRLNDATWLTLDLPEQPRHYHLVLPPGSLRNGELRLGLDSPTLRTSDDPRPLGVRVDGVSLAWHVGWHLPPFSMLAGQLGIGLLWVATTRRIGLGWEASVLISVIVIGGLVAGGALAPSIAGPYQTRLLVGSLVGAGLLWGCQALLPRIAPHRSAGWRRAILLILLLAVTVRLVGSLLPLFFAHDLITHSDRLRQVQFGQLLITSRPWEFATRTVVIVPAVYQLLLPITLLTDNFTTIHGFSALLDATTPFLVGLLALRLGLAERSALLAATLIALLPIHLTALYWGFTQQIIGQWLALLLLTVVAGDAPRTGLGWAASTVLITVGLLSHPGVLLLTGTTFALWLALGLAPWLWAAIRGRMAWHDLIMPPADSPLMFWRNWSLAALVGASLAFMLQYASAALMMLGGLIGGDAAGGAASPTALSDPERLRQIWVGLNASFAPFPLILGGAGLVALGWTTRGHGQRLALAWTASILIFLGADLVTGQQVRYGYFSAPLVCLGIATLLAPLHRHRLGQFAIIGLVALVWLAGLSLWVSAIYGGVKPSINPLTH